MLGRLEYQRGNIQAALHVFDGIDIAAVIPKVKPAISKRVEHRKRRSSMESGAPPMSIHAISLLFEAIFLKSKCLQILGRYKGEYAIFDATLAFLAICLQFFTNDFA